MFIYQKYQMGHESQREIKETGNMFISLLEKYALVGGSGRTLTTMS